MNERTVWKRSAAGRVALAVGLFMCWTAVQAQPAGWPARPLRFIVGNAPGGGLDLVARLTSPTVSTALGQQVIIDNRPGATGSVAAELTAKAAPDGYTIFMGSIGNLAVNPHIYKGLGYDPIRDLAPVTFAVSGSNVLVVHSSVPVTSVKELITLARAKPGALNYGSSGAGNAGHLAAELLSSMTKIQMVHIPYKGGAPAMAALLANDVQLVFASPSTAIPQVKAGRVKGLAVTTLKRSLMLPDLPTLAESGLPGYDCDNWYGIATAMKTPRPIIDRLNQEFGRALNTPEIKEALLKLGLESAPGTPDAFGKYMKSEYEKWGKLIAAVGIRGD